MRQRSAVDGTIRFAAYQTYQVRLDTARLGINSHDPKATVPGHRGATATDVAAVLLKLTTDYVRYFGKTQPQAATMAGDAFSAFMNIARECE